MTRVLQVVGAVAAAVLGAAVALCAVLVHQWWWGLVLAWGATAGCLVAFPGGWTRRFAFAAGWVVALVVLAPERGEGDYLVAGDPQGYALLVSGAVVLAAGVSGIARRRTEKGEDGPIT